MEKYKNAEYYRGIIEKLHSKGLNYSKIALYLNNKGFRRFDSGQEYSRVWLITHMKEDIFDPYLFDAIIYLSKKRDINKYIDKNVRTKTDFLFPRVTRSALQAHLNNK